jgi:hypothetical protein
LYMSLKHGLSLRGSLQTYIARPSRSASHPRTTR